MSPPRPAGTGTHHPARPARRRAGLAIAVAVAVFGLAVLAAVQPFTGDQALFADSARRLARGAVLSRDVWDVKQPGIYLFYLAGGAVGGYSETWLHLFEGLVQCAFAATLTWVLAPCFARPWLAAIVPLASIGTYYATIEPVMHGQVESLVGIPLFFTLWCGVRGRTAARPMPWFLLAGFAAGTVLVFKLVLAPIAIALALTAIIGERGRASSMRSAGLAYLIGATVPLAACVAYFAAHQELGRVWWTYVEVTPRTTAIAGRPLERLVGSAGRFAARDALAGASAVIGVWSRRRDSWTRLDIGFGLWILAAIPTLAVQHWWIYQFSIFLVPLAWFAARAVEHLLEWRPSARVRAALVVAAVVLAAPLGFRVARQTVLVGRHGFAATGAERAAIRRELEPQYSDAHKWAQFVRARPRPGDTQYVLGNPLLAYEADLPQPVAINGWSPEQYPPEVWKRLLDQLDRARPRFLAVDRFSERIVRARHRQTWNWIRRHYRPVAGVDDVDFSVRRAEFDPARRAQR